MAGGDRRIHWLSIGACVLVLALFGASTASAEALSDEALRIADALGYDEASIQKLMAGKIVSHQLHDEEKKELALTVAVVVPSAPKRIYADLESKTFFEVDRTIHSWGPILDSPATAASFAELVLPDSELDALLAPRAGDKHNLSADEITSLVATAKESAGQSKGERRNATMQAYRELLAARIETYRASGIAGIAPYQRKKKRSEPAKDLARALPPSSSLIAQEAPEFYRRLSAHPIQTTSGVPVDGVEDQFLWLLQGLNDRPAVVLVHRVVGRDHANTYAAHRDFYVSHTVDALQIIVGCLPLGPDKSVFFYANRTYTEQVAGFGSGMAHGIGRKILNKEVRALLDAILAEYRAEASSE